MFNRTKKLVHFNLRQHYVDINHVDEDRNDRRIKRKKLKYRYSIAHLQQYQTPLLEPEEPEVSHSMPVKTVLPSNDRYKLTLDGPDVTDSDPIVKKKNVGLDKNVSQFQKMLMRSNSFVRDQVVVAHGQKHKNLDDLTRSKSEELSKTNKAAIGQMVKTYTEMSLLKKMKAEKQTSSQKHDDYDSEWSFSSISSGSSSGRERRRNLRNLKKSSKQSSRKSGHAVNKKMNRRKAVGFEMNSKSNGLLPLSYSKDEDDFIDDNPLSVESIDLHKSVFSETGSSKGVTPFLVPREKDRISSSLNIMEHND